MPKELPRVIKKGGGESKTFEALRPMLEKIEAYCKEHNVDEPPDALKDELFLQMFHLMIDNVKAGRVESVVIAFQNKKTGVLEQFASCDVATLRSIVKTFAGEVRLTVIDPIDVTMKVISDMLSEGLGSPRKKI